MSPSSRPLATHSTTWTRFAKQQPGDREASGEAAEGTQDGGDGVQQEIMSGEARWQTSVDPPLPVQEAELQQNVIYQDAV